MKGHYDPQLLGKYCCGRHDLCGPFSCRIYTGHPWICTCYAGVFHHTLNMIVHRSELHGHPQEVSPAWRYREIVLHPCLLVQLPLPFSALCQKWGCLSLEVVFANLHHKPVGPIERHSVQFQIHNVRCSSAAYSFMDSPSFWLHLWNRKRSAITRGLGAMCRISNITSSLYSLFPGLSGAVRECKSVNVFQLGKHLFIRSN